MEKRTQTVPAEARTQTDSAPEARKNRDLRVPFHEKVFIPRESLLTEMTTSTTHHGHGNDFCESTQAMYNLACAGFLWLFVRLLLEENKSTGGAISVGTAFINLVFSLHRTSLSVFGGLFLALIHVAVLNLCTLSVVPLVQLMKSKLFRPRLLLLYYFCIVLFILSYASIVCLYNESLAPASGLIVMCEAARLSMKVHAYSREKLVHGLPHYYRQQRGFVDEVGNGGGGSMTSRDRAIMRERLLKQLSEPLSSSTTSSSISSGPLLTTPLPVFIIALESFRDYAPSRNRCTDIALHGNSSASLRESQPRISIGSISEEVSRFMFFLFVPTLIYRDSYPLSSQRGFLCRLTSALSHLLSFISTVIVGLLVTHGMITPILSPVLSSVRSLVTTASFFLVVYEMIVPSMILFILTHFAILHAWQNIFASLLGFADKAFYGSWWTANSWGSWYRRWNLCVGEFLWSYVYNDVQRAGYSLTQALISVFLYSAVIHELILICAFKFFNPALFVFFTGPGVFLLSLTRRFGPRFANTFMWLALSLGVSLLFVVYAIEGSLRQAELRHKTAIIGTFAERAHSMAYDLVIPRTVIALLNVLKTGEFISPNCGSSIDAYPL